MTGKLLTQWFGIDLHWLPVGGYCTFVKHPAAAGLGSPPDFEPCGGPVDWATHLIMPWFTFAFLFLALYTRMIRASVAESLHEDYVRTARAKGARERRVMASHVLPNASLRVLTMVGMDIGTALGVAVFVEFAYGLFGLARLSINAMTGDPIGERDRPADAARRRDGDRVDRRDRQPDRRHALCGGRSADRHRRPAGAHEGDRRRRHVTWLPPPHPGGGNLSPRQD